MKPFADSNTIGRLNDSVLQLFRMGPKIVLSRDAVASPNFKRNDS